MQCESQYIMQWIWLLFFITGLQSFFSGPEISWNGAAQPCTLAVKGNL